jgi:FKBP-type peptidyl-prolyl cis-trans isomerase FkpA
MKKILLFALLSIVMFTSCKDKSEKQLADDLTIIQDHLTSKGLTAQQTGTGLHYIITVPGSNEHPTLANHVKVFYKGYTLDGAVFDQTTNGNTADFLLANLIQGWQEGIPLLGKGGKGTFFLPSYMAYGERGTSGIPANTVLAFDIELVDFY